MAKMDSVIARHNEQAFNTAATGSDDIVASFKARISPDANPNISKLGIEFRSDFKKAFTGRSEDGLRGSGLGILLKYSYYDTKSSSWGAAVPPPTTPWDNLVTTQGGIYRSFITNDEERSISIALREGLMDDIPREVHYISLGPGESTLFEAKEGKILQRLFATSHILTGASTIDINDRYAVDAATTINEIYNCDATAWRRDLFAYNMPDIEIKSGSTPLVIIFGGLLQNMPQTNGKSADEELATFFHKMNKALPTAHVIMSVDTVVEDTDPALTVAPYEINLEMEWFVLNPLARAIEQGIITNNDYNVFKHWNLCPPEWKDGSVNLYIEAKNDHSLHTIDGDYDIKVGDKISISKSRKAPIDVHKDILKKAGYKNIKVYPQAPSRSENGQAKLVIHARP